MKAFPSLIAIFLLTVSAENCGKKTTSNSYKGRLEIAGICMNYTIGLLEGAIDSSLIAASWTDETNGKTYNNVFRLGSPCNFPASIKQGDEFYFVIDSTTAQNCAVCQAYYPAPSKSLRIKVVQK